MSRRHVTRKGLTWVSTLWNLDEIAVVLCRHPPEMYQRYITFARLLVLHCGFRLGRRDAAKF